MQVNQQLLNSVSQKVRIKDTEKQSSKSKNVLAVMKLGVDGTRTRNLPRDRRML